MEIRGDHQYRFDQSAEVVWNAIGRTDSYRSWWPWLSEFEGDGLTVGDQWRCTIQPPMPYPLRMNITIDEVEEPMRITASVTGDIRGGAAVVLTPTAEGCEVRLSSALTPTGQPLKAVAAVTPWLARFGHGWILESGFRQFRHSAF